MEMEFKINHLGLIVLIAGVLALVSIFLDWWSVFGIGTSAWSMITGTGGSPEKYYATFVLVLAAAVAVFAILEFMGMGKRSMFMTRVPVMAVGALIVVLSTLTMRGHFDAGGIGFYLAVIAGIALLIVPLLGILRILPDE